MKDWLDQIIERLDQGTPPTEAEVRKLVGQLSDAQQTIQILTNAAMDFARTVTDSVGQRQRSQRPALHLGEFEDHAGQFIDK